MLYRVLLIIFTVSVTGCAVVPESIQIADEANLIAYPQAASNPDQYQGKQVRWGGVIAKVENLPEATMLELVHYPLRNYGRPVISDESIGRFRVYVDGFLDPMVYEVGRAITFKGEFIGTEEGAVGEHIYVFPTVNSAGYYLWRDIQQVEISTIHMWPYDHFWGHPYRPYRQRVIIRSGNRHQGTGRNTGSASSPRPSSERTGQTEKQQY